MRNSNWYNVCRGYRNYFETKGKDGYNTSSVLSLADSTAASTFINFKKKKLPDDLDENIWAEKKDKKKEYKETFVGEEAFLNYYKRYRKMSQDPDRYEPSPTVEFINETNRLKWPPAPFGFIKRKGKADEININHYNIGNNYGKALGKTIKHIKPKVLLLGNNKNRKGISSIIKNLSDNLEKLDLSNNFIGFKQILDLTSWMKSKSLSSKLVLRNLNLSGNKLRDDSLVGLSKGMKISKLNLKILDLSRNLMGDFAAFELGQYLKHAQNLEILNLSWNRITPEGGVRIFEGLREGRSCRSWNISYNSLGRHNTFAFVEAVQCALNEDTIKHLDLSFNRIKKKVCEKFGNLIMDNNSLFGLHLEGNEWYVDKYGFIQVDEKLSEIDHEKHSIIYPRNLNGFSTTMKFSKINSQKYRPTSNCWVCEGWTEQTFEFKLGSSFPDIVDPVHIHFEYNFFKPELMRCKRGEVYSYTTMCPPGKIKYFFSIDKNAVVARDHPHTGKKLPRVIDSIQMYDEKRTYKLPLFNYRIWEQGEVLNDWYMSLLKECFPRQRIF